MSMPAKRRSKRKLCPNPNGKEWSNDDKKFGQRMLEKMGWKKGCGLGVNLQGMKEHVKVSAKSDTKGLGCNNTTDNEWIHHQQNFENLLSELSPTSGDNGPQGAANNSSVSLEERSKNSRARVHYQKFTRGKDISQYSQKDLASIFGKKANTLENRTFEMGVSKDNSNNSSETDTGCKSISVGHPTYSRNFEKNSYQHKSEYGDVPISVNNLTAAYGKQEDNISNSREGIMKNSENQANVLKKKSEVNISNTSRTGAESSTLGHNIKFDKKSSESKAKNTPVLGNSEEVAQNSKNSSPKIYAATNNSDLSTTCENRDYNISSTEEILTKPKNKAKAMKRLQYLDLTDHSMSGSEVSIFGNKSPLDKTISKSKLKNIAMSRVAEENAHKSDTSTADIYSATRNRDVSATCEYGENNIINFSEGITSKSENESQVLKNKSFFDISDTLGSGAEASTLGHKSKFDKKSSESKARNTAALENSEEIVQNSNTSSPKIDAATKNSDLTNPEGISSKPRLNPEIEALRKLKYVDITDILMSGAEVSIRGIRAESIDNTSNCVLRNMAVSRFPEDRFPEDNDDRWSVPSSPELWGATGNGDLSATCEYGEDNIFNFGDGITSKSENQSQVLKKKSCVDISDTLGNGAEASTCGHKSKTDKKNSKSKAKNIAVLGNSEEVAQNSKNSSPKIYAATKNSDLPTTCRNRASDIINSREGIVSKPKNKAEPMKRLQYVDLTDDSMTGSEVSTFGNKSPLHKNISKSKIKNIAVSRIPEKNAHKFDTSTAEGYTATRNRDLSATCEYGEENINHFRESITSKSENQSQVLEKKSFVDISDTLGSGAEASALGNMTKIDNKNSKRKAKNIAVLENSEEIAQNSATSTPKIYAATKNSDLSTRYGNREKIITNSEQRSKALAEPMRKLETVGITDILMSGAEVSINGIKSESDNNISKSKLKNLAVSRIPEDNDDRWSVISSPDICAANKNRDLSATCEYREDNIINCRDVITSKSENQVQVLKNKSLVEISDTLGSGPEGTTLGHNTKFDKKSSKNITVLGNSEEVAQKSDTSRPDMHAATKNSHILGICEEGKEVVVIEKLNGNTEKSGHKKMKRIKGKAAENMREHTCDRDQLEIYSTSTEINLDPDVKQYVDLIEEVEKPLDNKIKKNRLEKEIKEKVVQFKVKQDEYECVDHFKTSGISNESNLDVNATQYVDQIGEVEESVHKKMKKKETVKRKKEVESVRKAVNESVHYKTTGISNECNSDIEVIQNNNMDDTDNIDKLEMGVSKAKRKKTHQTNESLHCESQTDDSKWIKGKTKNTRKYVHSLSEASKLDVSTTLSTVPLPKCGNAKENRAFTPMITRSKSHSFTTKPVLSSKVTRQSNRMRQDKKSPKEEDNSLKETVQEMNHQ